MHWPVTNFGGNLHIAPRYYYSPRTESEVLAILDRHRDLTIRACGSKHAWSPGIVGDVLIDLAHFDAIALHADAVTVGAGLRIRHLLRKLHRDSDRTLPSIGLIAEQTVAGAISTATHGSGRHSLSHYAIEIRTACYDENGNPTIRTWTGDDLRAARCALGALGVIVGVTFQTIPKYDVAETLVACDTLDEVLAGEAEFPIQQFFLLPHRWTFVVQRRKAQTCRPRGESLRTSFYRLYWRFGIDFALHVILILLARWKSARAKRFFYQHVLLKCIPRNRTVVDRSERMLTMKHELFRHYEMEVFIPARHLAEALRTVRQVIDDFAGTEEKALVSGTFVHHYPICVRKVLPDDALMAMSSGDEPYYAVSFISLAEPREPFLRMADVLAQIVSRDYSARLHWGKHYSLDGTATERLYPQLPLFRRIAARADPHGVFRNGFIHRVLFNTTGFSGSR